MEYVEQLTGEIKVKREENMRVEDIQVCNVPH
jgi:hypothetical protein